MIEYLSPPTGPTMDKTEASYDKDWLPSLATVVDQGADGNTQALFAKKTWFNLFSTGNGAWKAV